MKRKSKLDWLVIWKCAALVAGVSGIVVGLPLVLALLASSGTTPKASRFTVTSLPRFEVSTARVDAGRSLTIIFDKRTAHSYLMVETPAGVALSALPWKDQCASH